MTHNRKALRTVGFWLDEDVMAWLTAHHTFHGNDMDQNCIEWLQSALPVDTELNEAGKFMGDVTPVNARQARPDAFLTDKSVARLRWLGTQRNVSLVDSDYTDPDQLLQEYRTVFRRLAESLRLDVPLLGEDFDWWAHIVEFYGTYEA